MDLLSRDGWIGNGGDGADCPEFDDTKYELDYLCLKDGHEWGNTGFSLRVAGQGYCIKCGQDAQRERDMLVAVKKLESKLAEQRAVEALNNVDLIQYRVGDLCKWGHQFAGSKHGLLFAGSDNCVECSQECPDFDDNKYVLGKLCTKHPLEHEWGKTQSTLRIKSGGCVLCNRARARAKAKADPEWKRQSNLESARRTRDERLARRRATYAASKKAREAAQEMIEMERQAEQQRIAQEVEVLHLNLSIDTSMYQLGRFCKLAHNYENCGYTLRYVRNGKLCVECSQSKTRQHKAERRTKTGDQPFWGNLCARNHDGNGKGQSLRDGEGGGCIECKHYTESTRRALELNCVGSFSKSELMQRMRELGFSCAYCQSKFGADNPVTADHFVPLSKGGTNWGANIIPCCHSCNSSKNDRDAFLWYSNKPFFNQLRWLQITEILEASAR